MTTEQPPDLRSEVKSFLEMAALIASFGAFLSALLIYFGWTRTRVLFGHFGVPVSLLQYSSTEYLLRSAEILFKPAIWTILALAALVATSVAAIRVERTQSASTSVRFAVRAALAIATLGCLVYGLMALDESADASSGSVLLCVAGALTVLQYVHYHVLAGVQPPKTMLAVGVLMTLAATFWAVSIYAKRLGDTFAENVEAGHSSLAYAVVHSTTDLGIAGQQGRNCKAPQGGGECRFIYNSYRLLTYANQRWILIQEPWSTGSPTVILPDIDSVRVELTPVAP
ncbi:MAG: hypothetical protein ABWY45_12560 [Mycobacterium sp.]